MLCDTCYLDAHVHSTWGSASPEGLVCCDRVSHLGQVSRVCVWRVRGVFWLSRSEGVGVSVARHLEVFGLALEPPDGALASLRWRRDFPSSSSSCCCCMTSAAAVLVVLVVCFILESLPKMFSSTACPVLRSWPRRLRRQWTAFSERVQRAQQQRRTSRSRTAL